MSDRSLPASASSAPAGAAVGAIWGILLLATIFLPWGVRGAKVEWSWQILRSHSTAQSAVPVLIASWAAGLIALFLAIGSRGLGRAVGYLLAGGTAVTTYLIARRIDLPSWLALVPVPATAVWAQATAVMILAVFLVVTGVAASRRHGVAASPRPLPPSLATVMLGVIQALTAAGLIVLLCMGNVQGVRLAASSPRSSGASVQLAAVAHLAATGLAALGLVLALAQPLVFRAIGRGMTRAGRWLVLASQLVLLLWAAARPAIEDKGRLAIMEPLNNGIILAGISLITIAGLAGVLGWLTGGTGRLQEPKDGIDAP